MVHKLKRSIKNIYARHVSRALISKFLKQVQGFMQGMYQSIMGPIKYGAHILRRAQVLARVHSRLGTT